MMMESKWNAGQSLGGFACRLYKRFDRTKNLFFSPHSISAALSLAYLGAHGRTAEQMRTALGYGEPESTTKAIMDLATTADPRIKLAAANSAWIQSGFQILDDYRKRLDAFVRETDFSIPNVACAQINKWVEENTNSLIHDLIPPGVLDAMVRIVLVNAIHFKAPWTVPFEEKRTFKCDFHNLDGRISIIDMMAMNEVLLPYLRDDTCEAVYLPYGDGSMGMLVVMPDEFQAFSDSLDNDRLQDIFRRCGSRRKIDLRLPKFKLESTLGLSRHMRDLGMVDAFSLPEADFSGISSKRDLYISAILHKAVVEVSEEGTEAAAATAVVMRCLCMSNHPRMIVKRPFIFAICLKDGTPLFMGQAVSL
jgi:serpin B